jgi:hypothetical protein
MESLITEYLFGQKYCSIPGLGVLRISEKQAALLTPEKKMQAPVPFIEFIQKEEEAAGLIGFIAGSRKISMENALLELRTFAKEIMQLPTGGDKHIKGVGRFVMIAKGEIGFEQETLSPVFLPAVSAERVIRSNISHQMLVGDKETTTAFMNEQLSKKRKFSKDLYWVWVLVISLLVGAAIFYYFMLGGTMDFGNADKIHPADEPNTYEVR